LWHVNRTGDLPENLLESVDETSNASQVNLGLPAHAWSMANVTDSGFFAMLSYQRLLGT